MTEKVIRKVERCAIVPFPSEQAIENMSTERLRSEHNKIGTQSFHSRVNSLFVRSRNWIEDATERLLSQSTLLRYVSYLHVSTAWAVYFSSEKSATYLCWHSLPEKICKTLLGSLQHYMEEARWWMCKDWSEGPICYQKIF